MKEVGRLTEKEFNSINFGNMSYKSREIAKEALVYGRKFTEIAEKYGLSYQRCADIAHNVEARVLNYPKGWREIKVWLPLKEARQVQKLSKKLQKIEGIINLKE